MKSISKVKEITTTLATTFLIAAQPVASQIPAEFNNIPVYSYGVGIMDNITRSEVRKRSANFEIIKSEKEAAFLFFGEQRKFNEKESVLYNNMLERLSVETGVNVLDLL